MRILMDQMSFNPAGNEVTLIKRRECHAEPQMHAEAAATGQNST